MAAFLEERLAEDRTWTAPQLAEALAERFGVRLAPKVISRHLRAMGHVWKRTRYVPLGRPTEEEMKAFAAEEEEAKRGRERGDGGGIPGRERVLPKSRQSGPQGGPTQPRGSEASPPRPEGGA